MIQRGDKLNALIIEHAQEQIRDVLREKKAPERIRPMGMNKDNNNSNKDFKKEITNWG